MASQLRVNKSENRSGLGTITYTDTGAIVSGIVTANSFSGDIIGNITGAVTGTTGSFSGDVSIAEKIIHTGDTNTFMKFDTDTVTFETAGDEALRIDSSGRIGIDYTPGSGDGPFNIDVTGSNNIFHLGHGTNNDNYYTTGASGTQYFRTPSANQLVIKSDGKIGIGTDNPAHLLHLEGASPVIQFEDTDNAANIYSLINAGGSAGRLLFQVDPADAGTDSYVRFDIDGAEKLRITKDGAIQNFYNTSLPVTDSRPILQLGYGVIGDDSSGYNAVTCNAYPVNGDNSWHYIGSSSLGASRYHIGFGDHKWFTASAGTRGNDITWLEKLTIGNGYTGTVDVKGIPAHLRLYSQRATSDWDSDDPIGKLEFYIGDDTTNNLPYVAASIECNNGQEQNNLDEPSGSLRFYTRNANDSSLRKEKLHITSDGKQVRHSGPINDSSNRYSKAGWYRWQSSFNNPVKECYVIQDSGSENRNGYIKVTVTHIDYPGGNRGVGGQEIGFASFKRKAGGTWFCWKSDMSWVTNSNQHGSMSGLGSLGWANAEDGADTNVLRYTSNRNTNYDTYWMQVEAWHSNGSNIGSYVPAEFYTAQ